jgi:CrcB protein
MAALHDAPPSNAEVLVMSFLFVAIGGALGSVLRYFLSLVIPKVAGFPWPTFVANVLGCLCIGVFSGLFLKCGSLSPNLKLFLVTGFCGGFTTFSTFANENLALLQSGKIGMFAIYAISSFVLGVAACAAGLYLMGFNR